MVYTQGGKSHSCHNARKTEGAMRKEEFDDDDWMDEYDG